MVTPLLQYEFCYLLQILLMPTTLANPSASILQRIEDTIPVLDSFIPFAHPFVGGMQSTTSS